MNTTKILEIDMDSGLGGYNIYMYLLNYLAIYHVAVIQIAMEEEPRQYDKTLYSKHICTLSNVHSLTGYSTEKLVEAVHLCLRVKRQLHGQRSKVELHDLVMFLC